MQGSSRFSTGAQRRRGTCRGGRCAGEEAGLARQEEGPRADRGQTRPKQADDDEAAPATETWREAREVVALVTPDQSDGGVLRRGRN